MYTHIYMYRASIYVDPYMQISHAHAMGIDRNKNHILYTVPSMLEALVLFCHFFHLM